MITHYCPHLSLGGINRLALDLVYGLQQQAWDNTLLCPSIQQLSLLTKQGLKHASMKGEGPLSRKGAMKELLLHLRDHPCDIIQVYKVEHAQLVWDVVQLLSPSSRPRLCLAQSAYPKTALCKALHHYDAVTTCSKQLRRHLRECKSTKIQHLQVIPYGIAEENCSTQFNPSRDWWQSWLHEFPDFSSSLSLCIPGALCPETGLEQLADIIQELRQRKISAHAYLTGDSRLANPKYLKQIRKLYQDKGIANNINWLDARSDMREIMSACNITLSLSQQASSHRQALLEALALGRPVLAFACGYVEELLSSIYPQGLIPLKQSAAMIDRLEEWHINPPEGPSSIPKPYRLSDTIDSYQELYTMLIRKQFTKPQSFNLSSKHI